MGEKTYSDIPDHGPCRVFDELHTDLLNGTTAAGATKDLDDAGIPGLMWFDLNYQGRWVREGHEWPRGNFVRGEGRGILLVGTGGLFFFSLDC